MGKKGPDKGRKPGPVRDWTLWSQVGRSVDPIAKRKTADPKAALEESLREAGKAAPIAPSALSPSPAPRMGSSPLPSSLANSRVTVGGKTRSPYSAGGIEPGLKRRLERGALPIDATLDLHGMTQEQAFAILKRFLPARAARGDRTILVITGKGLKKTGYLQIEQKGILRAMLPLWLADPDLKPLIAGLDQAHQSHGGEGAFYIRLKRLRPGERP